MYLTINNKAFTTNSDLYGCILHLSSVLVSQKIDTLSLHPNTAAHSLKPPHLNGHFIASGPPPQCETHASVYSKHQRAKAVNSFPPCVGMILPV